MPRSHLFFIKDLWSQETTRNVSKTYIAKPDSRHGNEIERLLWNIGNLEALLAAGRNVKISYRFAVVFHSTDLDALTNKRQHDRETVLISYGAVRKLRQLRNPCPLNVF